MAEKLSLEELRRTQAYLVLTAKQAKCVEAYLEGASKLKAVQSAYVCNSEQSAKVLSYTVFGNPAIVTVLAIAAGEDAGLVAFRTELDQAIKNPKLSIAQVQALKLQAQINGYIKPAPHVSDANVLEGSYVDIPDAPARGLQAFRMTEFEREAAGASCDDNPWAPHNASVRRDNFCGLITWRQNGQTGNYWSDEKESRFQTSLLAERAYWAVFPITELAEYFTFPIAVGQQWNAQVLSACLEMLK